MNLRLLSRVLVFVAVCSAMLVNTVVAYVGQNPYSVLLQGPFGIVGCQSEVVITATVRSAETGRVVSNQTVLWDITTPRSISDWLSSRSSATGVDGKTSVTLRFGPVDGPRTVRAMIASWPATIDVSCRGGVSTSTAAPTGDPTTTAVPSTNPSDPPNVTPPATPAGTPPATGAASAPPVTPMASNDLATATPLPPAGSGPIATEGNPPGPVTPSSSGSDLTLAVVAVVLALGLGAVVLVRAAARR